MAAPEVRVRPLSEKSTIRATPGRSGLGPVVFCGGKVGMEDPMILDV
jgi:hypothetical protein